MIKQVRTGEEQYLELGERLLTEGEWVYNERTGKRCLTVINADFEYDASKNKIPLVTTRQSAFFMPIAEKIGYWQGLDNAADFRALKCFTWDANANTTKAWLANPNRKGEDDMGRVYGVQGRDWQRPPTEKEYQEILDHALKGDYQSVQDVINVVKGDGIDQLQKIYNNLRNGIDDRGEILTFFNPGEFKLGCLRPCMHTHMFSILGDKLYLTSYQRSIDFPLGLVFNMPQTVWALRTMAQITGLKPAKVFHKMANVHIYEDQLDLMKEQLTRKPYAEPEMKISSDLKTLEDIDNIKSSDDIKKYFSVEGYESHAPIKYPFSE